MVLTLIAFGLIFAQIAVYKFTALTFVMTFTWGLQDASVSNFANIVFAFEFESKTTPFSVYKFSQSLFTFAFLVVASKIDEQIRFFIYFGCFTVVALGALTSMLFFKYKVRETITEQA